MKNNDKLYKRVLNKQVDLLKEIRTERVNTKDKYQIVLDAHNNFINKYRKIKTSCRCEKEEKKKKKNDEMYKRVLNKQLDLLKQIKTEKGNTKYSTIINIHDKFVNRSKLKTSSDEFRDEIKFEDVDLDDEDVDLDDEVKTSCNKKIEEEDEGESLSDDSDIEMDYELDKMNSNKYFHFKEDEKLKIEKTEEKLNIKVEKKDVKPPMQFITLENLIDDQLIMYPKSYKNK